MTLKERIRGLDPKDSDAVLARLWKDFSGTQYFEALMLALEELREKHLGTLFAPSTGDRERAHAAGGAYSINELLTFIRAAIHFDASQAVYEAPGDPETDASTPDSPVPEPE